MSGSHAQLFDWCPAPLIYTCYRRGDVLRGADHLPRKCYAEILLKIRTFLYFEDGKKVLVCQRLSCHIVLQRSTWELVGSHDPLSILILEFLRFFFPPYPMVFAASPDYASVSLFIISRSRWYPFISHSPYHCFSDSSIPGLRPRAIQSHKCAAVFLAQDPHEGGKTFSGVASSDLVF